MSQLKAPKKPIPDWETVRDEWVRAVERLVADVESWCKTNDWPTRRIDKRIEENKIGEYVVPGLLIQVNFVKLMLEPGARFVTAADGVMDLYVMPQYDNVASIIRRNGTWQIRSSETEDKLEPFTAEVFTQVVEYMI
jgi:hypothetical protein